MRMWYDYQTDEPIWIQLFSHEINGKQRESRNIIQKQVNELFHIIDVENWLYPFPIIEMRYKSA